MNKGFSFTEVLVSLLLMTSVSLLLLKQQWQTRQLFNQRHGQLIALIELDNKSEDLFLQTSQTDPA